MTVFDIASMVFALACVVGLLLMLKFPTFPWGPM